ncbi:MAG: phage terminase large subunit [Clostridia bacterium]|nr:phage terminase large subunit [Clostridia bacterium]
MGNVNTRLITLTRPYPKQEQFFTADSRYIAYGGARGGGKSWAARVKAVLLALEYDGIQILLLRRDLHSLRENHIYPLLSLLKDIAKYKAATREFVFKNQSRIVLGYCASDKDVLQYQGQSYDVIFMEEATQFSEFAFSALTESNRSSGMLKKPFSPRMYFTCNPGGIGHGWVKRLFVDKRYKNSERAADYTFIPSRVYDNPYLLENSPDYVRSLENLPPNRRKAMLDGNWDVFEGQYFSEFDRSIHVVEPFDLPGDISRYIAIDYGLDMLACLWIGVDRYGHAFVYRELYQSGLILSEAAQKIQEYNCGEQIRAAYAPPDLFFRRQETGQSAIDIFAAHGLSFSKSNNNRIQGWYSIKEWLKPVPDTDGNLRPRLRIFKNCINLIRTLPALRFDEKNPNDTANAPHELTHAPDALRAFTASVSIPYTPDIDTLTKTAKPVFEEEYTAFLNYGT